MAFGLSSITGTVDKWDGALQGFFSTPAAASTLGAEATIAQKSLQAGKSLAQNAGFQLNSVTYNIANKIGDKMLSAASSATPGFFGNLISNTPILNKLATGLSNLGKTGGSKIPGLGTLFALGTAAYGIVKAGGRLLQGDWKGAGHQLLKTGGSVVGLLAGGALMATGIGFLPGLALAIGAGFAADWAGKKVADTVFSSVAEREALQERQANAYKNFASGYAGFNANI